VSGRTIANYEVHDEIPEAARAVVDRGLGDANDAAAPLDSVRSLSCFARIDGVVIGGAVGRTWGLCCELQQLWVDERHRRRGIARELVQRFESHAASRGCTTIYLDTFSFQAPAMYRKLGYVVAAEIRGFPDGIAKFTMVKTVGRS
jgi:ribosomal protein S18 acetylase RimI-like enzyme